MYAGYRKTGCVHLCVFSKIEKTRVSYRVGTTGMHLGGDRNPLIDLVNLIETRKKNKNHSNNPKFSKKP
jgi:hypothetical protein